jgi:hypothetical protein
MSVGASSGEASAVQLIQQIEHYNQVRPRLNCIEPFIPKHKDSRTLVKSQLESLELYVECANQHMLREYQGFTDLVIQLGGKVELDGQPMTSGVQFQWSKAWSWGGFSQASQNELQNLLVEIQVSNNVIVGKINQLNTVFVHAIHRWNSAQQIEEEEDF